MDYGLAQLKEEVAYGVGTSLYSAPEILLGLGQYSNSVDVWSIGVIFFLMLTGEYPFPGKTVVEVIEKIKQKRYKLMSTILLTGLAREFLKGCLRYDPKERLQWD